jgi:hypothetical protein
MWERMRNKEEKEGMKELIRKERWKKEMQI